ncbi:MAG: DNA primase [Kiritimatiellae bacterium]|nr:DNA primase [Kiritimatiellia bacterium]
MAGLIPKRVLDDIQFKTDIVELIGSYFALKRTGSTFKAVCPFHKEKTPSFHVNPQRQIFHCFGCGAGGNVFGFVMQHEGVPFIMAVKILAQRAGIVLEYEDGDGAASSDKAALYDLHTQVADLYHLAFMERETAEPARKHIEQRGISADIVETFRIGYAPKRWDAILKWAVRKKYSLKLVEQSGLIMKRADSSGDSERDYYDRFRNRIMFPISDEQGRIVGFSGRTLDDNAKEAKYINSPDTPLFHKSKLLYALDKARRNIVESREALICEGQLDVICCHQAGFNTAIAAQGTAFTSDHVHILRRYADSACIMFDQDKAGRTASIRTSRLFMTAGLAVRIATLPDGEDPDSFIRQNGPDAFAAIIKSAGSAVSFQVEVLSKDENIKSEIGAMRIAKAVLATISHSPNSVQRASLIQESSSLLGIPASALQDDLRHMMREAKRRASAYSHEEPEEEIMHEEGDDHAAPPQWEEALCEHMAHILDFPELGPLVQHYLPLDMITNKACRMFTEASIESLKEGLALQEILNKHDQEGVFQRFFAKIQMAPDKIRGEEFSRESAVQDLILYMWRNMLKQNRSDLERKLSSEDNADIEQEIRQITYDLKSLKNWDDGQALIEIHISE